MRVGMFAYGEEDDTWWRVTETDTDHMVFYGEFTAANRIVEMKDRSKYLYFLDVDDLFNHVKRLGKGND